MELPKKFDFSRGRGVVWVCDLKNSTKYMNDDKYVDALEEFFQRLYWTSAVITKVSGGEFIKWTGDGFLSWFETPLHRQLGDKAKSTFRAAWHLSLLVNATKLGIDVGRGFKLRHGVTYEHDALITKIIYPGGFHSRDLTGRSIVLAFRLSGVEAAFPGLVTQRELVEATRDDRVAGLDFKKWEAGTKGRLKYFKGERLGLSNIFVSDDKLPRARSMSATIREAKKVIDQADAKKVKEGEIASFEEEFINEMRNGPKWCGRVVDDYVRFLRSEMLLALRTEIPMLEQKAKAPGKTEGPIRRKPRRKAGKRRAARRKAAKQKSAKRKSTPKP